MLIAFPKNIIYFLPLLFVFPALAQQPTLDSVSSLIAAGKMKEAAQAVTQLDQAQPQTAHLAGIIHFNLRDYKQAIADFERAVRGESPTGPAYRESSQLLGRAFYLTNRSTDALPWLEQAWKLGDRSGDVLYMLGNAYIDAANPNGARFAFSDLYGIGRDTPAAYLLNARMMLYRKAPELAARQLDLGLVADPKLPGAHYLAAELAARRDDLPTAIAQLKLEIEIQPDHSAAYVLLGDVTLRAGQLDAGIDALRRAVWLNPYQTAPYLLLGQAYLQKSDFANAEGVLRRALQADPDSLPCLDLLARTLKAAGKTADAEAVEQRAAQLRRK